MHGVQENNMELCFKSQLCWGSQYKPRTINMPFPKREIIDSLVTRFSENIYTDDRVSCNGVRPDRHC